MNDLTKEVGILNPTYRLYADDLVIMTHLKYAPKIIKELKKVSTKYKLTINNKKSGIFIAKRKKIVI